MATITYTVTVASGTNQYGTGNKFYINGSVSPDLNLIEGNTYIFDQSDSTNGTHFLAFSTSANNSPAAPYTTGVTVTGTPGTDGKTTIVVATYAPTLYYYCTAHAGMGATAFTPAAGSISNQSTFESTFTIDEVIEDAYERCGVQGITGYQLKAARRSLNILFQEWGNRGLHYWEVGNTNVLLVQGQSEYTFYRSTADGASSTTAGGTSTTSTYGLADILEASYRQNYNNTNQSDSPLTKVDRSTYTAFSNKTALGTPSQFWVQRFIEKVTITIYPLPNATAASNFLSVYYVKRIQDAGAYTNASDTPFRFIPCMISGLAYYLSMKFAPQRTQEMKLLYEDELARALSEDGSAASTYITPKTYYPNI